MKLSNHLHLKLRTAVCEVLLQPSLFPFFKLICSCACSPFQMLCLIPLTSVYCITTVALKVVIFYLVLNAVAVVSAFRITTFRVELRQCKTLNQQLLNWVEYSNNWHIWWKSKKKWWRGQNLNISQTCEYICMVDITGIHKTFVCHMGTWYISLLQLLHGALLWLSWITQTALITCLSWTRWKQPQIEGLMCTVKL